MMKLNEKINDYNYVTWYLFHTFDILPNKMSQLVTKMVSFVIKMYIVVILIENFIKMEALI